MPLAEKEAGLGIEPSLAEEILDDEDKAGEFLKQAVLSKEKHYNFLTPELLERICEVSSKSRWRMENVEAALQAYCTFLTIERLWGRDEAAYTYRKIAQKLVYARQADISLEKGGEKAEREERGTVIYLGTRGAEAAQVISQQALLDICDEFKAQPVVVPYYRSHIETANLLDSSEDPEGNFLSFDEILAELIRVKGSPPGEGLNICIKMKINKKNKISVFHGVANVGKHIIAGSGYADALRLRAVRKEGIIYSEPKRADAYRAIKVKNTNAVVLISLGDGAIFKNVQSLENQVANRVPVVNFIQNNKLAIGAQLSEVVADENLWKRGHGCGIPGIRIEKDDPEGLYMAIRFAAKRALLDAGPAIVESMTTRLLPHSSAHGDCMVAEYIEEVGCILAEELLMLSENDPARMKILSFIDPSQNNLFASSKTDNQLKLYARLTNFLENTKLLDDTRKKLFALRDEIIDPLAVALDLWQEKGYITAEDISNWEKEARDRFEKESEEVFKRDRPDPKNATKNIRLPTPEIKLPLSGEVLELNMSEAIRKALADAMDENPNVLVFGTDVYKGKAVFQEKREKEKKIVCQGGYFRQEEGLFERFASSPRRLSNMPIDELIVADYLMGFATTPADSESLKKAFRVFYDPQYADYGIEAMPSFHVFGSVYYSTSGKITRPFGMLLLSGAHAGGGHMHSHELASAAYQAPEGVDVFYTSEPETTYKLLKYCLLYENNPYIFMVDKTRILGTRQKFEIGNGFFTPGRARVIREGNDLQFISYGPMVNTILEAIEASGKDNIGLLDLVSLRPFPTEDLHSFLEKGSGRIVIAHQEPKMKGFGAQIKAVLYEPEFADIKKTWMDGQPSPVWIGSEPVSAPPCDKLLLDAIIPSYQGIKRIIDGA